MFFPVALWGCRCSCVRVSWVAAPGSLDLQLPSTELAASTKLTFSRHLRLLRSIQPACPGWIALILRALPLACACLGAGALIWCLLSSCATRAGLLGHLAPLPFSTVALWTWSPPLPSLVRLCCLSVLCVLCVLRVLYFLAWLACFCCCP